MKVIVLGAGARVSNRIDVDLWQKFIFLAAIAAACGLARAPLGSLRERPLGRRLLQRAVQEVVDVARARGIPLADDKTTQVTGAVSRYAEEAGISAPIHDTVTVALAGNRRS